MRSHGANDHFDYIVLHPYEVLNGIADNTGSEAVYMNIVPTVRKLLAAQNPAKVNVPYHPDGSRQAAVVWVPNGEELLPLARAALGVGPPRDASRSC